MLASRRLGGLAAVVLASACLTVDSERDVLGVVASATPEATEAGARILRAGGNAMDAAVAVSFALAVTEPAMSGLGGQTQILLFSPESGPIVINGTSFSPAATPTDAVKEDLVGHRATTVPTTLKVLDYAWRRYGSKTLSWADLLGPAIDYAEQGFPLGPFRHRVLLRHQENLKNSASAAALFLRADGSAFAEGERFRQPVLARTLRRLAREGADVFYRGVMAREIAADMERHAGWIRYEDLAELKDPIEQTPLWTTYRGYDAWSLPPPGGGWVVLLMLNMLETFQPDTLRPNAPDRPLLLAKVLHLGHAQRRRYPITDLRDYAPEVAQRLSKAEASRLLAEDDSSGETTHFSIVDAEGLGVSVTASINNYYGAKVAHPGLGFLYNDYMNEFEIGQPEHRYGIRPQAMPYSSMSPTILTKDGEARLVLGSPGSARIISAITQVLQLWVNGVPLKDAVAHPRLHVSPRGQLLVENPEHYESATETLIANGFDLREPADDLSHGRWNPYFGGVHALALESGNWVGAADPRRDGTAVAVKRSKEENATVERR